MDPYRIQTLDELDGTETLPVQPCRATPLKGDLHVRRTRRSGRELFGHEEGVRGWFDARIFQHPTLDARPPEIPVNRVRTPAARRANASRAEVRHLVLP